MLDINNKNWNNWQWQLRNAVGLRELPAIFPDRDFTGCDAVDALFAVKISPYYLELLRREGGGGPLSRMTLPAVAELESGGHSADPFQECSAAARCRGVKRRFPDRVLIMTSNLCATNCRHCTRRGVLKDADLIRSASDLRSAVEYVRANPAVREVLLSGGDPLTLSDDAALRFVDAFAALDQIDAVRIGTRAPVTLPMRVTSELVDKLGVSGKVWVNTQFNHLSEITPQAAQACRLLVESGIPVSNQAVLLRRVNDSPEAMFDLCAALQRVRVRPYYVFMCDPIAGIEHLRVAKDRAVWIEQTLAARIGGLALPRFVEDIPDAPRKAPINECGQ